MIDYNKIINEIEKLYLNDNRPWIIGFSGGKDSTCVAQMVYKMLKRLPPSKRIKDVHIVSADTLVESPIIIKRIKTVCDKIEKQSAIDKLPVKVKILKPELNDTFWVSLIGKGYPSPNKWFRWCTDRLKIDPMTKYIKEQVNKNGEIIILLGARKSESGSRAQTMAKYAIKDFRLRRHTSITNAFIYTPIEDLDYREVWAYLFQSKSPWGDNNKELINFYKKVDRECPMVIDTNTPSCGGSRFGCWTCTVVEHDKAMEGLIEDGHTEYKPMLEFRNWLKEIRDIPEYREPVRKNEKRKKQIIERFGREYTPQSHRGHTVLGPFTFGTRHEILNRLLAVEKAVCKTGEKLITDEELKSIEMIWIYEGDKISSLGEVLYEHNNLTVNEESNELKTICAENNVPIFLVNQLLKVEEDLSNLSKSRGIYKKLDKVLDQHILNDS